MGVKKVIVFIVCFFFICLGGIYFVFKGAGEWENNVVVINDISESLAERWGNFDGTTLPGMGYGLDYVVLDADEKVVQKTREGLHESINAAINNRDTIVDIKRDGVVLGKLVIYNNWKSLWSEYRDRLFVISILIVVVITLLSLFYILYIHRFIFRPFLRLQEFAKHVAAGDLDFPLMMDRNNVFGAFSESFDLMRDELSKARESELKATKSKKELVASLSHDIKTPVASIKAVSEVMAAKSKSGYDIAQLEIIGVKADQINTLITNMFHATLEELQELSVTVTEYPSLILNDMISNADYNNQVTLSPIPECIISVDVLRLGQVIDNIISNSYKYAGTSISIHSTFVDSYLLLTFEDFGSGVSEVEKPLLFNKFYRAKNAEGKSGTGLGLYISKYLMDKMKGDIYCKNTSDGFMICLMLPIS